MNIYVSIYLYLYVYLFISIYLSLSLYIYISGMVYKTNNIVSGGGELGSGSREVRGRFFMYTLFYLLNFEPLGC